MTNKRWTIVLACLSTMAIGFAQRSQSSESPGYEIVPGRMVYFTASAMEDSISVSLDGLLCLGEVFEADLDDWNSFKKSMLAIAKPVDARLKAIEEMFSIMYGTANRNDNAFKEQAKNAYMQFISGKEKHADSQAISFRDGNNALIKYFEIDGLFARKANAAQTQDREMYTTTFVPVVIIRCAPVPDAVFATDIQALGQKAAHCKTVTKTYEAICSQVVTCFDTSDINTLSKNDSVYITIRNLRADTLHLFDTYIKHWGIQHTKYLHRYDKTSGMFKLSYLPLFPHIFSPKIKKDVIYGDPLKMVLYNSFNCHFTAIAPGDSIEIAVTKRSLTQVSYIEEFDIMALNYYDRWNKHNLIEFVDTDSMPDDKISIELGFYTDTDIILSDDSFYLKAKEYNDQLHDALWVTYLEVNLNELQHHYTLDLTDNSVIKATEIIQQRDN